MRISGRGLGGAVRWSIQVKAQDEEAAKLNIPSSPTLAVSIVGHLHGAALHRSPGKLRNVLKGTLARSGANLGHLSL